ncbi:MAG TPA: zinc ribbon domain-containing protein, partial [Gemmatimonadales bacterium]|nr:zinc ribbon domain-containing protein [Gemmatimonadales bacterium]
MAGRKREIPTPELRCPRCAAEVQRFWANCSNCGRRLEWKDTTKATGAECYYCGWVVSDSFSFCPWCGRDIADGDSSSEPLKAPKGFKYHRRCQWGCGGGVMYPMRSCPWCGRPQKWRYQEFQNICPHCNKGVND